MPRQQQPDSIATRALNQARGVVVLYSCSPCSQQGHEYQTQSEIAKRLASIKEYEYAGEFDASCRYDVPSYFVPTDTLSDTDVARTVGIAKENDLFGGVVPFPFVATKTITHDLPNNHEYAPAGWSADFCRSVRDKVLRGFSAFTHADARHAAEQLLAHGKVRLKKAGSRGGMGQWVIANKDELDACLSTMEVEELRSDGVVLEANLTDVVTYSVGQVRVGKIFATYCGTQQATRSNHGHDVYGGSNLTVVRGDFDALHNLELDASVHTAIEQAQAYHAAALASYRGMLLSRANYDVAQGLDGRGQWRSGVLEQSWRVGGASAAEVAALAAFHADSSINAVRASTTEIYGENPSLPRDAVIHYQGVDERAGPLTKFSLLETYAAT